jgi:hypothetical protein
MVLQAVSASAPDAAWTVGWQSTDPYPLTAYDVTNPEPLIEHWDGTQWSQDQTPVLPGKGAWLSGTVALASDDVWAVGARWAQKPAPFKPGNYQDVTLIEHWDGAAWSVVPSPNAATGPGSGNQLLSVAAVSPNDIWAVGEYDHYPRVKALSEHWDGTSWTVGPQAAFGGIVDNSDEPTGYGFTAVSAEPAGGVLAATQSSVWTLGPTGWRQIYRGTATKGAWLLGGIALTSATDGWTVGMTGRAGPAMLGEHWDGRRWVARQVPADGVVKRDGMSASGPDDVWLIGTFAKKLPLAPTPHLNYLLHYTC